MPRIRNYNYRSLGKPKSVKPRAELNKQQEHYPWDDWLQVGRTVSLLKTDYSKRIVKTIRTKAELRGLKVTFSNTPDYWIFTVLERRKGTW